MFPGRMASNCWSAPLSIRHPQMQTISIQRAGVPASHQICEPQQVLGLRTSKLPWLPQQRVNGATRQETGYAIADVPIRAPPHVLYLRLSK